MDGISPDLQRELNELYEQWLEASIDIFCEAFDAWKGADGRGVEYDEWVEAFPKNLTDEELTANHAAGLPVRREHIVRCKDCVYFFRDATPHDEDCPHFCSKHGIDMAEDDGFCSWARRRDE